jgi:Integrase zinc binding domain
LLRRWAVQTPEADRVLSLAKLMLAPIESCDKELDWPTREALKRSQSSGEEEQPDCLHLEDGLWQDGSKRAWIPKGDRDIQIRLLVAAHMGAGVHRASTATFKAMSETFTWEGLKEDCGEFCRYCLHCLGLNTGTTVPRPMGSALHCDVPNGLPHFDYYWMGPGGYMKYVLILKDDLCFVRLDPTSAADAVSAADALISWFSDFGVAKTWVSDLGSYFWYGRCKKRRAAYTISCWPIAHGEMGRWNEFAESCRGRLEPCSPNSKYTRSIDFCVTNGASWSQHRIIGEDTREESEESVSTFATGLAAGVYLRTKFQRQDLRWADVDRKVDNLR